MLFMLKHMIDKHLTFGEAHQRAMKAVGKRLPQAPLMTAYPFLEKASIDYFGCLEANKFSQSQIH